MAPVAKVVKAGPVLVALAIPQHWFLETPLRPLGMPWWIVQGIYGNALYLPGLSAFQLPKPKPSEANTRAE